MVEQFINGNPKPSETEQKAFARRLQNEEHINLQFDLLMRLIRSEAFRRMDQPPVYDLEYDPALKKAVELLRGGKIKP
jgi:carboxyl-terminal processing protease